jgi:hypothetical protein
MGLFNRNEPMPKPLNIGSYRVNTQVWILSENIHQQFAKTDGVGSGEDVGDLLVKLRKQGFLPNTNKQFKDNFHLIEWMDLKSGLNLVFNGTGLLISNPNYAHEGWILYNNDLDEPIEPETYPSLGSHISLNANRLVVDLLINDPESWNNRLELKHNYINHDYRKGRMIFERYLACLENQCLGRSHKFLESLPKPVEQALAESGLRYVRDKPYLKKYEEFGHVLESEFVQLSIKVDGYNANYDSESVRKGEFDLQSLFLDETKE